MRPPAPVSFGARFWGGGGRRNFRFPSIKLLFATSSASSLAVIPFLTPSLGSASGSYFSPRTVIYEEATTTK
jgi:hypothetical protein